MEIPLLLQFCIAFFTGMVAATFVPPVRRSIPPPVEVILWAALVTVCVVGVVSITDPQARELSASVAWGADQVINTTVGLIFSGMGGWLYDHRFGIASWLVIVAGADIFALIFIGSWRSGQAWQPRVRLREWMELPLSVQYAPARRAPADPLAGINRRLVGGAGVALGSVVAGTAGASVWLRDVMVPQGARRIAGAAAVGRVESRARFDGLRGASAHLQYAARAWYAAAGEPALSALASRASQAMQSARAAGRGQVVDVRALLNAQSIGWYGPFGVMPTPPVEGGEDTDAAEQRPSDRLAS